VWTSTATSRSLHALGKVKYLTIGITPAVCHGLLSFGFLLKHTGCVLPIIGTPCDVPVPKNVIFNTFAF
jgi:hypothetical protein